MGISEIAVRLGRSRKRVEQLVHEKGFPPGTRLTMGLVFSAADVEAWIKVHRPDLPPPTPAGAGQPE